MALTTKQSAIVEMTVEERRAKVLKFRKAGLTERYIAERLNVSQGTIHRDLMAMLDEFKHEQALSTEQWRALELDRLDAMQAAIWPKVLRGDVRATLAMDRIMQRRAKYLGLDASIDAPLQSLINIIQWLKLLGVDRTTFFATLEGEVRASLPAGVDALDTLMLPASIDETDDHMPTTRANAGGDAPHID